MSKYRNISMNTRKVTTEKFYSFTRNFRNSYMEIISYYKKNTLSVQFLTSDVEKCLKSALDDLCEIYTAFTYQKVSACIKYISNEADSDIDSATIETLVRSTNSDSKRCEIDNNRTESTYIKDNTDFKSILSSDSENKKSYFYQRNLQQYAKKCGLEYDNSTFHWEDYYRATIVVPINVANKRLFFCETNDGYDVLGVLCIDSLSTDAFLERDEIYNVNIAKAFAAEMYIILNQYRFYLKRLTEKKVV